MIEESCVIAVYGSGFSSRLSSSEVLQCIENGDMASLRCLDVFSLNIEANELAENLPGMLADDADLLKHFRKLNREGALVLRIAPSTGKHVALLDLEKLLNGI